MLKLDKTNLLASKPLTTICRKLTVRKTALNVRNLKQRLKLGTMQKFSKMNASAKI